MSGRRVPLAPSSGHSPLYLRVARQVGSRIADGQLRPGDRLPSERQLQGEFGVSRVTMRQALSKLVDEGLVTSSPGRGWFVSTQLNEPPGTLLSFSEMVTERGLRPTSKVLEIGVRSATLDEAEGLQMAPGAALFFVRRLRLIDDMATALDFSRLPAILVPGLETLDFTTSSLYATLQEKYDLLPTRADFCVEALPATQEQAKLLEVTNGTPLLASTQTTYDQHDRPLEIGKITYRGDRYRFRAEFVSRARAPGDRSLRPSVPSGTPSHLAISLSNAEDHSTSSELVGESVSRRNRT